MRRRLQVAGWVLVIGCTFTAGAAVALNQWVIFAVMVLAAVAVATTLVNTR